ncbi:MAG: FHA domain-containing protein [Chitinophagaceae bacterium]|nr:FHA domain-containing protein [Anaerolineae bacterium]
MNEERDDKTITQRSKTLVEKPDTAILPANKRKLANQKPSPDTVTLGEQRELILVIRGMVERLMLPKDASVVLGRTDLNARFHPDIDLTPYGALDRGVSRGHARLHIDDDKLFVTDLGSTNGTFLAGKRLQPDEPTILRKGDELLLGRLAIQVLFR